MADTKQEKDSVVPVDVSRLIEESQKVQGWIRRLEEQEGEVRPEVYRRVRADYDGRLERVGSQLGRYRADLVAELERRRAEVASLREERESHAADLEEARLRHTVGEYSAEEWEERREGIEASLEEAEERLDVEAAAVEELAGIISSIGSGAAGLDTEPRPAPEAGLPEAPGRDRPARAPERSEEDVEAAETVDTGGSGKPARAAPGAPPEKGPPAPGEGSAEGKESAAAATEAKPVAPRTAARADSGAAETADAGSKEEGRAGAKPAADRAEDEGGGDYLDELEFLESLSLDEADRFDAVSAMLDEEESGDSGEKEG